MPDAFLDRLRSAQARSGSRLCVGLDPDPDRLPPSLLARYALPDAVLAFSEAVIKATAPYACAFKLNLAFFEALGSDGWRVLQATRAALPAGVVGIADGKRGDIGNTARFYARALFDELGFDACTVAPYMGRDAVTPFLAFEGRAAFVLGRTSNPGAADFQEQRCGDHPLYLRVARATAAWGAEAAGTAGLVVGATSPEALAELRAACPATPFLVPGVGAQGGDARAVVDAAATERGLVVINSSRQVLYADAGPDFAAAAAEQAAALREAMPAG